MLGSIIGGAISAAGSIFGGISASKAMKKVKRNLQQQQKDNQNWYDQRYNEDATQRADAQRILTQTQKQSSSATNRQPAHRLSWAVLTRAWQPRKLPTTKRWQMPPRRLPSMQSSGKTKAIIDGKEQKYIIRKGTPEHGLLTKM